MSPPAPADVRRPPRSRAALVLAALALAACSGGSETRGPTDLPDETLQGRVFAITSVDVVPMDRERVLPDRTVVVRDGIISEIGPTGSVDVPGGAVVIDGSRGWLMPGLADMHVHVRSTDLPEYLAHGVTTVRNMWGFEQLADIVARVESGDLRGPRILSLSPGIDAPPEYWPQTQLLTDPARADSMVRVQADRGYRTLKVYSDLRLEVYDSLVAATARRGMRIAGHVPRAVPVRHALRAGQASIEHLGGYATRSRDEWGELAALTAEVGTFNCPTLSVLARVQAGSIASRLELAGVLHDAGAALLVGTDAGIDLTSPGASIHDELDLLERAGLSPYEALLGATRRAARWFGEEDAWGTVAPGMRADLLLLAANPLEDASATRAHVGVLRGDLWLPLDPH